MLGEETSGKLGGGRQQTWATDGAGDEVKAAMRSRANAFGPRSFDIGQADTYAKAKALGFDKWLLGICRDIDLFWQGGNV